MNILFVSNLPFNPRCGGIERVTDLLAKELMLRFNHSVYYLICEQCDAELYQYDFPAPVFNLPSTSDAKLNKDYLAHIIKEHQIDIIINQRGQSSFICDIVNGSGIKIISVIHSQPSAFLKWEILRILSFDSGYIKFIIKLVLYPILYIKIYYRMSKYMSNQYVRLIQESSSVVLLSDKYKQEYIKLAKKASSVHKLRGIPNPNTFKAIECACTHKENIILYVGRLSKREKNPIRLLRVWKKLYRKYTDWKLVFVGDGDALYGMQRYVTRLGLQRVDFEGSQSDVLSYYKQATFICLTSNFEGWGMSLTEGMQCGCIPFTFNNYAAASDIIDDGINGCLIRPYNLNDYKKRLEELMINKNLRNRMSLAAKEKVRRFNIENVSMLWDSLIKSV